MLLSKAFPFVCVFDEMFGDLQPLYLSRSSPFSAPLEPNALLLALRCRPRCLLALLNSTRCYLLATLNVSWRPMGCSCSLLRVQSTGSRGRRQHTRFYYFLPSLSIPKAEDWFQMCPAANPIITRILGPTTRHRGFGISMPRETVCGLSFDIEKKNNNLVELIENIHSVTERARGSRPVASSI